MDTITTPLYATPWLVLGGAILIGYFLWGLVKFVTGRQVDVEGTVLLFLFIALFSSFIAGGWTDAHNITIKKQGLAEFEEYYGLSVVSGKVPLGTEKTISTFGAHLNDEAGLQACIVEIADAKYEVTCNGTVRNG